jgi:NAD(P)-dependent dehydrogenase (short-subunit alcohol dehydrogenase family)
MQQSAEVVVVTGASAGIGRATALEFGTHGAQLGLIARGAAGLHGARADIEARGGKALAIQADVSDSEAVEAAARRVEEEFGPIEIWVNVAFSNVFAPFVDLKPEEYRRITEVTYLGFVWGTLAALRRMRERNRGTIVQVGSALAYRSIPLQSAYCGAKSAIRGFTDSIRCELVHEGSNVHLTMVQMPAVNTPQFSWCGSRLRRKAQPVPPIYQPEVAGRAVYWAAHHRRRELWVGSSTVQAIVGQKFLAGLLDVYLGNTGYDAQQHDGPRAPDAPENLWEPVDRERDFGAHGEFDGRARSHSTQLWLSTHRGWLTFLALGAVGTAFARARLRA